MKNKDNYSYREQFSKRLARYGAIFWGIFLIAVLGIVAYQPETAMACVYLVLIVTANKMIDTVSYTKNSTTEKVLRAMLDKTSMELKFSGIGKSIATNKKTDIEESDDESDDDSDDESDDETEESEENG